MKKVAIMKSTKPFESRIAFLPEHLEKIDFPELLYFEKGYGEHLGISDAEYIAKGAKVTDKYEELLTMDILIDPKIGDAEYIDRLGENTVLFGYFHAVQNKKLTDQLIKKKSICYAWEDMHEGSIHVFNFNNILAGYASIMHASTLWGRLIQNKKVAVLGRGNTGIGAIQALSKLGADVDTYGRHGEVDFKKNLQIYDVVVNAVLWDVSRDDYIISKSDLNNMKKNSLIVDISCDIDGAIETSIPRSLEKPITKINDVYHYSLSNSPTLYAYDASNHFGKSIVKYVNQLQKDEVDDVLKRALIISDGTIVDQRIKEHQNR